MTKQQILLVDDESHILKSLQRLLMNEDYQIYTAESGNQGLELLKKHPIDLIISDQRMPSMNGSEFLARACQEYPDTIRILLTGYSDKEAIISAINNAKIYQYISKPWNNEDLKFMVKQALERHQLVQENKRLQEITYRQNEELKEHNLLLEEKVNQKTEKLDSLNKQLKENFVVFIRVFISIICKFDEELGNRSKRVTYISQLIGQKMGLPEKELEQLEVAALLEDIGLICLPKSILKKPFRFMSTSAQELYKQHPVIGQSMLSGVDTLSEVGLIIRSHHERYDGTGYPDRSVGKDIPLLSRIIRVADEFDRLKQSKIHDIPFSNKKCIDYLRKYSGSIVDREIVDYFAIVIREDLAIKKEERIISIPVDRLQQGMRLARAVMLKEGGIEILKADTLLEDEEIRSLRLLVKSDAIDDIIYVKGS
ncbi:MAG: HD domain-containing phosphohydrolase [bacterium]